MKLLEGITAEPGICGRRPRICGLRIRVTDILGMLAEGVSHEEVLGDFPYLEPDDIKAALAYAARQADHAVLQLAFTASWTPNSRPRWRAGSAAKVSRQRTSLKLRCRQPMTPRFGNTHETGKRSLSARTKTSWTAGC